jgi:hypothetical protein
MQRIARSHSISGEADLVAGEQLAPGVLLNPCGAWLTAKWEHGARWPLNLCPKTGHESLKKP